MCAFQIFCLFKGIQSLYNTTVAPVRAVPSVAKALLIQAIVVYIFSILAVELYENIGNVCKLMVFAAYARTNYVTSRGDCIRLLSQVALQILPGAHR